MGPHDFVKGQDHSTGRKIYWFACIYATSNLMLVIYMSDTYL